MSEATQPISRRNVAKGIAWTAPLIIGATAAPAYASSGGPPTISIGGACKAPGNSCNPFVKGYIVTMTITNSSHRDVWLYVSPTITVTGTDLALGYAGYSVGGGALQTGNIKIPAGEYVTVQLNTTSQNSANKAFDLTLSFTWGHTANPADDTEHTGTYVTATTTIPATPPDCCK